MEAHPRTMIQVFRSDVRLTVPLFQRPYVWSAEQQWEPLWEDVLATRDRFADGDTSPHFMGAVVLVQRPRAHGSLEMREVIDGQQRLTTLQLLICALRDAYAERDLDSRLHRRLTKLLENDVDMVDDTDEVFRLWPTNRDRVAYRRVMQGHYRRPRDRHSTHRIPAAYLWFSRAIDDEIDRAGGDVADVLDSLAAVIAEGLEMVVIDLGIDDNAQVIFETLNARGTPLRPSDLIKNLIFRTLEGAARPVEELYAEHWRPLEAAAWDRDVRLGRLVRNRLDVFMNFFLVVWLGREVQAHQVFPAARAWIGNDASRAETLLREAARYAAVYDELEALDVGDADVNASLRRLQIVDTLTLTPLLLWLVANASGSERLGAIKALESYVVRRSLCKLSTANYNRGFLELLKRLSAGETPVDEVVVSHLAAQSADSGMWPTDAELHRSFSSLPLYKQIRKARLQEVLRVLDTEATSRRSELIDRSAKLTLEHLMPQKWQPSWAMPEDGGDEAMQVARREELIHTIGNLTLLTQSLNSELANGPWERKRAAILDASALSLNRQLPIEWDESSILARSAWLADLASAVWPRPEPAAGGPSYADESDRDLRIDQGTGRARPAGKSGSPSRRRDVGAHIQHAFGDLRPGDFLTIQQISRTKSPEYGDDAPSPGAISARLFPRDGRPSSIAGVEPARDGGVRGAKKVDSSE